MKYVELSKAMIHVIRQLSCYKPKGFVRGTDYSIHFPINYLKNEYRK